MGKSVFFCVFVRVIFNRKGWVRDGVARFPNLYFRSQLGMLLSRCLFTGLKQLQKSAQNVHQKWTIVKKGKKVVTWPSDKFSHFSETESQEVQPLGVCCCKETITLLKIRSQQLGDRPPHSLAMSYAGISSNTYD